MNVLVTGYGSMGQRRAAHARALGHTVCVRDANSSREMAARVDGYQTDPDFEPDAEVLSTPAKLHAGGLRDSDAASVLVEKPLALAEADLARRARRQRRVVVGYTWRYHPGYQALKERASAGGFSAAMLWSRQDVVTWPGKQYADTLLEFSHEVDLALWLFGPASLTSAHQAKDGHWWSLDLAHESGVTTNVVLDATSPAYERGAMLIGNEPGGATNVRMEWGPGGGSRAWGWTIDEPREPRRGGVLMVDDLYRAELSAFLAQDPAADPATYADGVAVLRVCDEARRRTVAGRVA